MKYSIIIILLAGSIFALPTHWLLGQTRESSSDECPDPCEEWDGDQCVPIECPPGTGCCEGNCCNNILCEPAKLYPRTTETTVLPGPNISEEYDKVHPKVFATLIGNTTRQIEYTLSDDETIVYDCGADARKSAIIKEDEVTLSLSVGYTFDLYGFSFGISISPSCFSWTKRVSYQTMQLFHKAGAPCRRHIADYAKENMNMWLFYDGTLIVEQDNENGYLEIIQQHAVSDEAAGEEKNVGYVSSLCTSECY